MFSLVAGAALPFRAAPALFRVCLVAWLLAAACLAFGAEKKQAAPPALPEVPETLTPEQADALLAKLPTMFQSTNITRVATGAAIQVRIAARH